jgi:hypothetical protein
MHVHFIGEFDDGISVSSHHARALTTSGVSVSFENGDVSSENDRPRPDIIHLVTFEQSSNALLRQLVAARVAGVPIVRYWIGRDYLWAKHHAPSQEFARAMTRMGALQLCRSPELAEQLGALGVAAKVLPVISSNISSNARPQGLPKSFTALCYLPIERREFHGGSVIDELVGRLPSVRFLILGGGGASLADQPNAEWLRDCTDSIRAIQRSTVVLDARVDAGLSRLVLEALCHGRHVITGYHLPHAHVAHSTEKFVAALRALRDEANYNLDGRSYVDREHEHHTATKALRRELEDAIQPGRLNLVLEGGFRGAATTLQNLHLLSHRNFPLPDADRLPAEAYALGCLLQDMRQIDRAVAV